MNQEYNTIVIIAHRFCPPTNGGENFCYYFSKYLSKNRKLICVSSNNNKEENLPFKLIKLFNDVKYKYINLVLMFKLFYLCKRKFVKTCILNQPFMGLVVLPVVKLLNIKLIIYAHNVEYLRFRNIGKWWCIFLFIIEWIIYRHADKVIFVSNEDRKAARSLFKLKSKNCLFSPHGTIYQQVPLMPKEKKTEIFKKHFIDKNYFVIIFFGTLNYSPNIEALDIIIEKINPILLKKLNFFYQIIICGGGLPKNHLLNKKKIKNIQYLGFVDNIETYVKASDLVINPVLTKGGGAKSKVIEAIALGKSVISSYTGAIGLVKEVCHNKLFVLDDDNFYGYYEKIVEIQKKGEIKTNTDFYNTYYWGNTVKIIDKC